MNFSKYNKTFHVGGKLYIYNLLSTALVGVDELVENAISLQDTSILPAQYIADLASMNFIIDDETEEEYEYRYFYDSLRFSKGCGTFSLTFVPTYGCNLCCPYCMQGKSKPNQIISAKSLQSLLLFIDKYIAKSYDINSMPINQLYFSLFGGEPLMAKEEIKTFCDETMKIANKYNCQVDYSMTSNFTLIDDDVLQMIQKFGITTQVSIDGNKNLHDKSRVHKDGRGTFNTIIENLKKMKVLGLEDKIVIRINVTNKNIEECKDVYKDLLPYSNDIYFGFVDNFKDKNDSYTNCIEHKNYSETLSKEIYTLEEQYGRIPPRAFGKKSPCSMITENRYMVDPDLDLYKCEILLGRKEYRVGHILPNGEATLFPAFYKQMGFSPFNYSKCVKCDLLPLCAGGCGARTFISNSDSPFCEMTEEDLRTYLTDYVHRKLSCG